MTDQALSSAISDLAVLFLSSKSVASATTAFYQILQDIFEERQWGHPTYVSMSLVSGKITFQEGLQFRCYADGEIFENSSFVPRRINGVQAAAELLHEHLEAVREDTRTRLRPDIEDLLVTDLSALRTHLEALDLVWEDPEQEFGKDSTSFVWVRNGSSLRVTYAIDVDQACITRVLTQTASLPRCMEAEYRWEMKDISTGFDLVPFYISFVHLSASNPPAAGSTHECVEGCAQ